MIADDSGYVIVGETSSFGVDSSDVFLIKTDSRGNLEWQKTVGGLFADSGISIQKKGNSDYVIAGTTNSYGSGGRDVYLVKIEPENRPPIAQADFIHVDVDDDEGLFRIYAIDRCYRLWKKIMSHTFLLVEMIYSKQADRSIQ